MRISTSYGMRWLSYDGGGGGGVVASATVVYASHALPVTSIPLSATHTMLLSTEHGPLV